MAALEPIYALAVLLGGLLLLTVLVVRAHSIFVAAPLCALLILVFSGADAVAGMTGKYMTGFAEYLRQFFFVFALGAAFGKLMEASGAAATIAEAIVRRLGSRWACLAVVLACAVLTYGGVSLFVVGFSVYPLALQLFRDANLPRRFIPASIAFGSVTFTMTSAGSPEIQNLIPIRYLIDKTTKEPLTDALAGWPASLIVALVMFVVGQAYLEWALHQDTRRGEGFQPRPGDSQNEAVTPASSVHPSRRPGLVVSLLPLAITLLSLNALPRLAELFGNTAPTAANEGRWIDSLWAFCHRFAEQPALAIFAGVVMGLAILRSYLKYPSKALGEGFVNGLLAIGATCSVVGFGSALSDLPAFKQIVDWITHLPGDPLIGAALAVAVIAGIAGSASGGQGLALPILKPLFIDQLGVAPRALHRVVSIASGSLDSMPANGYVVMLIRNICGETHSRAYGPIFVTTVLVPLLGTILAIWLFKLVPSWAFM